MGYAKKGRKRNRLKGYNYNDSGYYFITICTHQRIEYFGDCIDGKMFLNERGLIAERCLEEIEDFYENVVIDEYIIMPNHVHLIISIIRVGTEHCSVPTKTCDKYGRHYGLLSKVIKSYKNAVTNEIRQKFRKDYFRWQRSYHDHIIRNKLSLEMIRRYIQANPRNWKEDRNNPINIKYL